MQFHYNAKDFGDQTDRWLKPKRKNLQLNVYVYCACIVAILTLINTLAHPLKSCSNHLLIYCKRIPSGLFIMIVPFLAKM